MQQLEINRQRGEGFCLCKRLFQLTAWWWISLRICVVSLTWVSHGLPTSWGWWSWWELAVLESLPALEKGGSPAGLPLCHCLAVKQVLLWLCGWREGMISAQSRLRSFMGLGARSWGYLGLVVYMVLDESLNFLCLSPPTMQIFIYLAGALVEINELFVKHFEDEKLYKMIKYYYVCALECIMAVCLPVFKAIYNTLTMKALDKVKFQFPLKKSHILCSPVQVTPLAFGVI